MTLTPSQPAIAGGATPAPEAATRRTSVWDPLVRLIHWTLVGAFSTAFLVGDDRLGAHTWAGYVVLAAIALRVVWGFVGTRHARFRDFVRGPGAVGRYLEGLVSAKAPRYLGHNPAGGAMVIALLLLLTATALTGLATYGTQEMAGPLAGLLTGLSPIAGHRLEEVHELLANLTLGFIVVHVLGVLVSSLAHRENLVRAMLDGRKRAEPRRIGA